MDHEVGTGKSASNLFHVKTSDKPVPHIACAARSFLCNKVAASKDSKGSESLRGILSSMYVDNIRA